LFYGDKLTVGAIRRALDELSTTLCMLAAPSLALSDAAEADVVVTEYLTRTGLSIPL
jgi:hypothetical protein